MLIDARVGLVLDNVVLSGNSQTHSDAYFAITVQRGQSHRHRKMLSQRRFPSGSHAVWLTAIFTLVKLW